MYTVHVSLTMRIGIFSSRNSERDLADIYVMSSNVQGKYCLNLFRKLMFALAAEGYERRHGRWGKLPFFVEWSLVWPSVHLTKLFIGHSKKVVSRE